MPYTERQQQMLNAMGIVPWVQRDDVPRNEVPRDEEPNEGVADTGLTFADRPLRALASGISIGHAQAPLLVIVESDESPLTAPLSGDAAQLFEQMMRSIDITRSSVCQCCIASSITSDIPGQDTIASQVSIDRLAGIVLTHEIDDNEQASAHASLLQLPGRNALPMWRIPHPDILLMHPLRKRQAWQALKAVRQILAP